MIPFYRQGSLRLARPAATGLFARASAWPLGLRFITSEKWTPQHAETNLVEQRKHRVTSPHLSIYKPQYTWILSGAHRITGVFLCGGMYLGLICYAALPVLGYNFTAASVAAAFGSLPVAVKGLCKLAVAAPFAFHFWNGIRHLVWDTVHCFKIPQIYSTAYLVLGMTAVSALGLLFL